MAAVRGILRFVEAGAIGLFFVQAVRLLYGGIYSRLSGAEITARLIGPEQPLPDIPGVITYRQVQVLLIAVGVAALLPLFGLILRRWPFALPLSALIAAIARIYMGADQFERFYGAAIVLGASGLYLALTAQRRPDHFPAALTLGLALDQLFRAMGDTWDVALLWPDFLPYQAIISVALFPISLLAWGGIRKYDDEAPQGMVTGWGGLALGGLLFLELTALAFPNVAARWADVSYEHVTPWIMAATTLPLIPAVRERARRFLDMFDPAWRGWAWFLLMALMLVIGRRFGGPVAGAAMIIAQLLAVLTLWWTVRPAGNVKYNPTGFALVLGWVTFLALSGGDFFTFEYAYAPPPLNGFRGMGLALSLGAALLGTLPAILKPREIPWRNGPALETLATLALVTALAIGAGMAAVPLPPDRIESASLLRFGTYNIHGGYSLFFDYALDEMADVIGDTSVDVVLLQEVDAGRLVSFGVDQALWMGRRLRMEPLFFPTNEAVQGLAILSRVPVAEHEGHLLPSMGLQTGVQRAIVRMANGGIDVYNTWLGLLVEGGSISAQEQDQFVQIREILTLIERNAALMSEPLPVVLGGTFNNVPGSPVYNEVAFRNYVDPFAEMDVPEDAAITLRRMGAGVARFDYIWLRGLRPRIPAVIERDPSDHRLVVVEVEWGRR